MHIVTKQKFTSDPKIYTGSAFQNKISIYR